MVLLVHFGSFIANLLVSHNLPFPRTIVESISHSLQGKVEHFQ